VLQAGARSTRSFERLGAGQRAAGGRQIHQVVRAARRWPTCCRRRQLRAGLFQYARRGLGLKNITRISIFRRYRRHRRHSVDL
jgi:hypothetical protein